MTKLTFKRDGRIMLGGECIGEMRRSGSYWIAVRFDPTYADCGAVLACERRPRKTKAAAREALEQ